MGRWLLRRLLILLFTYICFSVDVREKFGMCADPDCSEPVAYGETSQNYRPDESNGLEFISGQKVEIYVRGYGEKDKLGVKIEGKKGYVPKNMVKEIKIVPNITIVPAKRDFMDDLSDPIPGPTINPTSHKTAEAHHQQTTASSVPLVDEISGPSKLNMPPSKDPVLSPSYTLGKIKSKEQHVTPTSSIDANSASESTGVPGLSSQSLDENGKDITPDFPGRHKDPKATKEHRESNNQNVGNSLTSPSEVHAVFPSNNIRSDNTVNSHKTVPESLHFTEGSEKTEKLSSSNEESLIKEFATKTEKAVREAVDAVVTAHLNPDDSQRDVSEETVDAEVLKTMSMLEKRGVDTNDIIGQEYSVPSSTDSFSNSVSDSHTVDKSSDIMQTADSPIVSSMNSDSGLDRTSFNDSSNIQPSLVTNHQGEEAESEEATTSAESHNNQIKVDVPETDSTHKKNPVKNSEENFDDENDVNENENFELDDYSNDETDQTLVDDPANSSEAFVLEKSANYSEFEITNDDNVKDSDSNNNAIESSNSSEKSEVLTPVPNADHAVNHSESVEFHKSEEPDISINDSPEAEEEEEVEFPDDEDISGTLNDRFDRDPDAHVSSPRHILQDNNSGSATVAYDSNNSNELGDTQNPIDAFPESSEHHNPNAKAEEMVETSSIFSMIAVYETCSNTVAAFRALVDSLILLIPEPITSYISSSRISARASIFTGIIAFPLALLFLAAFYIKEKFKEENLKNLLRETDYKLYLAATERDILREEAKNLKQQLVSVDTSLAEEKSVNAEVQKRLEEMEFVNKTVNSKQRANIDVIKELHMKNDDYVKQISDLQLSLDETKKQNADLAAQLHEEQNTVADMNDEITKLKQDIDELEAEKELNESNYYENEKSCKEKITQLEQSCSQLLQEGEAWNSRVNELSEQLYSQISLKEELEKLVESKDSEIESLKVAFSNMEVFQNLKTSGGDDKTVEENMKTFMDVSSVQNELRKVEEINKSLTERLQQEKKKVLDMEVELLETRSDVEKMRASYNQALQDKAEAQTKLDVLTKYFKDKELQLQKELGVQEAVRQRKEEDATHAERRVILIEKENESYKYQVASLKQEIEETERNLKNQIAAQEKKAHENWLAARAAERKAEEVKQESANLRQRLTLLEREQENWLNSSQSDIVRPVPQRLSDTHDLSGSQEGSISSEFIPRHMPPPGMHDDLPLSMRPSSRPLLPPPPIPMMPPPPPHFMPPPFDPMMPPHRPQPWRMVPEKHFDPQRRNTPSDFEAPMHRRRHTPPYYESDRRSLSPVDGNSRSRGSSPHEALPDFHNVPPPLQRHPEYYPPGQPPRFPPPMHRSFKSLPSFRTGNQLGNDGSRPLNDKEFRQPHPDADV